MRIVFGQPKAPVAPLGGLLQRQCACGNHADGSECAECSKKKRTLERAARDSGGTGRQGDAGDSATLAHELGHILINSGAHPVGTVMGSRPAAPAMRRPRFTDPQCTTLHSNA